MRLAEVSSAVDFVRILRARLVTRDREALLTRLDHQHPVLDPGVLCSATWCNTVFVVADEPLFVGPFRRVGQAGVVEVVGTGKLPLGTAQPQGATRRETGRSSMPRSSPSAQRRIPSHQPHRHTILPRRPKSRPHARRSAMLIRRRRDQIDPARGAGDIQSLEQGDRQGLPRGSGGEVDRIQIREQTRGGIDEIRRRPIRKMGGDFSRGPFAAA